MRPGHTGGLYGRARNRTSALTVAAGGIAGATARWALIEIFEPGDGWPTAAFTANLVGCLLLGLLMGRFRPILNTHLLLGATSGFCGALTTFSGFALDIGIFIHDGRLGFAVSYLVASVTLGLAAFVAGAAAGRRLLVAAPLR